MGPLVEALCGGLQRLMEVGVLERLRESVDKAPNAHDVIVVEVEGPAVAATMIITPITSCSTRRGIMRTLEVSS